MVFLTKLQVFLQNYLFNTFKRSIINGYFSSFNEVTAGAPLGNILGSFLFKGFLNGIFLFISKCQLYDYADDNSLKPGKKFAIEAVCKWTS